VLTRTETQIDHHWTLYGPCPETGNGFYSARWQTELKATKDTTCVIGIEGNDGFRLFINDTCIIDQWQKAGFHASTHALQLQKGQMLRFKLEFKEPQANGSIKLYYETKKHLEKHFVQLEKAIAKANVAVVVVDFPEGEFQDRSSLRLASEQIALIKELKACGLPVLVVINGGSAVTMQEWQAHSSAILYAWYMGEAGGAALAHVLTGQVNPSGKLPITIPQHEGQLPLSYWHEPTGRGNDYVNGTGEPLYPFGHGLSYTQFEYRDLKIEQTSMASNDTINLSFKIQNTGAYPGAEALQFYIKPLYTSETLPVQYLIRTEKTHLKNGETQLYLHYKIPVAALDIPTGPKSTALPTQFYLQIGASSKDIRLQSPVITLSE
jgi:beta-glucosidase